MGLPRARVDELLDLVGLTGEEAKRRVGNYSLGMRQRLGIAHALLGDPEVLILDEPANGLDPAGSTGCAACSRFADRGGTVLLSSHLLHEIEVIADDLVVIGRGKIVAQGRRRTCSRPAPGALHRRRGAGPDGPRCRGDRSSHGRRRPERACLVEAEPIDVGRGGGSRGWHRPHRAARRRQPARPYGVFLKLAAATAREGVERA